MIKFALLFLISVSAIGSFDPMTGRNEFMSAEIASKKWGSKVFSVDDFKQANTENRAKMSADLVKRNPLKGLSSAEIKKMLGSFTGYYWSHRIPAYLIEEGWENDKDTWQVVFALDNSGKVSEVKLHKNCCYNDASKRQPSKK